MCRWYSELGTQFCFLFIFYCSNFFKLLSINYINCKAPWIFLTPYFQCKCYLRYSVRSSVTLWITLQFWEIALVWPYLTDLLISISYLYSQHESVTVEYKCFNLSTILPSRTSWLVIYTPRCSNNRFDFNIISS